MKSEKHRSLSGKREATRDLQQQLLGRVVKPEATLERRVRSEWGKADVDSSFQKAGSEGQKRSRMIAVEG